MLRTGHTDHVNRRYGIKSDTLQWRQNEPDGVPIVCSTVWSGADQLKKTPKLRAAGLCQGNPPITAGFPWQRASNAVNVSIWWRHHDTMNYGNLCREGDAGPITRNMVIILAMMMMNCLGKYQGEGIPGSWFNIKMSSYQYRKYHCGDKTILRPSYLHNGISYTGKTTSLYWIGLKVSSGIACPLGGSPIQSASGGIITVVLSGRYHIQLPGQLLAACPVGWEHPPPPGRVGIRSACSEITHLWFCFHRYLLNFVLELVARRPPTTP